MKKLLVVLFALSVSVASMAQTDFLHSKISGFYGQSAISGVNDTNKIGQENFTGVQLGYALKNFGFVCGIDWAESYTKRLDTLATSRTRYSIGLTYQKAGLALFAPSLYSSDMNYNFYSALLFTYEAKEKRLTMYDGTKWMKQKASYIASYNGYLELFRDQAHGGSRMFYSQKLTWNFGVPFYRFIKTSADGEVIKSSFAEEDVSLFLYNIGFEEKIFAVAGRKYSFSPILGLEYGNMGNYYYLPNYRLSFGFSVDGVRKMGELLRVTGYYDQNNFYKSKNIGFKLEANLAALSLLSKRSR